MPEMWAYESDALLSVQQLQVGGSMKQSKADQAWGLFQSLMRQYPLWPSTFSICECGRELARGAGKCSLCIKEELANLVGDELTDNAENALKGVAEAWNKIREQAGDK